MGAIYEFTKKNSPEALQANPLDLPNTYSNYKYTYDLPFIKDLSEELMMMLN